MIQNLEDRHQIDDSITIVYMYQIRLFKSHIIGGTGMLGCNLVNSRVNFLWIVFESNNVGSRDQSI